MTSLVCFAIIMTWACVTAAPTTDSVELLMPNVQPKKPDTYLCRSMDANKIDPYITEFIPNADMQIAHHILLYGCSEPGSTDEVWNCGEMLSDRDQGGDTTYEVASVCSSGPQILYAWAMDAPSLKLPPDVAFQVGGDTGINKLVVQVHYKNVTSFLPPENKKDSSGLTLITTKEPKPRRAGVYLMVTGGVIPAHNIEYLETACPFPGTLEAHPFAFRTHTHTLGRVVSGYRIRDGQWTEIGRMDPRKPQMFYNVTDPSITLKKGDILAARCTMENTLDHDVEVGTTQKDEMCNFYIMYYTDTDKTMSTNICFKQGPPTWYLADYPDQAALNLDGLPDTASTVPASGRQLTATTRADQGVQGPEDFDIQEEGVNEDPKMDELLDSYIAQMDPNEVEAIVSQMLDGPENRFYDTPASRQDVYNYLYADEAI